MDNKTQKNVDHWSYSSAKLIYRKGIDYAVAERLGIIKKTYGKAVDIGQLAHAHLLGGEQEFVVNPYPDFRTKEAREWRDSQTLPIISEEEFEAITTVVDRIKSHPLANELIFGKGTRREIELKAKIEGKDWVGRADVVKVGENKMQMSLDEFLNLANSAVDKMKAGTAVEKDELCRILFLNLIFDHEKGASFPWKEPFSMLVNRRSVNCGGDMWT